MKYDTPLAKGGDLALGLGDQKSCH